MDAEILFIKRGSIINTADSLYLQVSLPQIRKAISKPFSVFHWPFFLLPVRNYEHLFKTQTSILILTFLYSLHLRILLFCGVNKFYFANNKSLFPIESFLLSFGPASCLIDFLLCFSIFWTPKWTSPSQLPTSVSSTTIPKTMVRSSDS